MGGAKYVVATITSKVKSTAVTLHLLVGPYYSFTA